MSPETNESRHFEEVCHAFAHYGDDASRDLSRTARDFYAISADDQLLLEEIKPLEQRLDEIRLRIRLNEAFIAEVLRNRHEVGPGKSAAAASCDVARAHDEDHDHDHDEDSSCDDATSSNHIVKVRSTLRQFVRDWSDAGAVERAAAYDPLLEDLETYLPLKNGCPAPSILCPGSGLGRLPFEVVRRGYNCQGNEFSYFMLLGSNFILNSDLEPNSCAVAPYVLSTSNRFGAEDHLRVIKLPDVSPSRAVPPTASFSMCAGEFVEVYWEQEQAWDGILTSFFLDTAKNIVQYIRTIARILKPGALWSNLGPLLYHFGDMPSELSIELSWEEVRQLICRWFELKAETRREAYYTTDELSMMQTQYHCIHFTCVRNETPVEGLSLPVY